MMTLNNNAIDIRPYQRGRKYVNIGNSIGNVLLKIRESSIRRQTIRELQDLTDAQLEDIGIPRYNIRRAVNAKVAQSAAAKRVEGAQVHKPVLGTKVRHATIERKIAA